jgi:bifunctional DNase/RNase
MTPEGEPNRNAPYIWRRIYRRLFLALYQRRVTLIGALVAVVIGAGFVAYRGIADAPPAGLGVLPIAMSVQELQPLGNSLPLILVEKNGSRQLIIRDLESTEARVIAQQQGLAIQGEQPRAYDLMRELLQQVGGRVDQVILTEAERDQVIGRIVVSAAAETRTIRAKPADAVALALKTGAPIYVENAVLERFGARGR